MLIAPECVPNRSLIAANGTPIRSYGTRPMVLLFNQSKFNWRFQVAEAHIHIIGADFLRAHGLVVDLANRRLICLADLGVLKGVLKNAHAIRITSLSKNQDNEFAKLLHDRPELTTPTFASGCPKHNIKHHAVEHASKFTQHPSSSDQKMDSARY